MKAVIQRTTKASVEVNHVTVGKIEKGYVVLLGIKTDDLETDARYLARKIANLRIFPDESGKLNLSIKDVGGSILSISQFTLYGDTIDGNRPSFTQAAKPDKAVPLYNLFNNILETEYQIKTEKGVFGADMTVDLINDGPCTIIMDSRKTIE